jgi:hypothetical protein
MVRGKIESDFVTICPAPQIGGFVQGFLGHCGGRVTALLASMREVARATPMGSGHAIPVGYTPLAYTSLILVSRLLVATKELLRDRAARFLLSVLSYLVIKLNFLI